LRYTWPEPTIALGGVASDADAVAWEGSPGDPLAGDA
jgi:hypothetical protein